MATIESFTETTQIVQGSDYMMISRGGVAYKVEPKIITGGIIKVTRTLTSAEVLALNGTPIVLLAAQGASTLIEPISVACFLQYNSTTYATATHLRVHNSGNTNYRMKTSTSFLTSVTSRREGMIADDAAAANYLIDVNTALVISANAVPITGDSPIFISALLRVVTF
jgi:hypothetical protein